MSIFNNDSKDDSDELKLIQYYVTEFGEYLYGKNPDFVKLHLQSGKCKIFNLDDVSDRSDYAQQRYTGRARKLFLKGFDREKKKAQIDSFMMLDIKEGEAHKYIFAMVTNLGPNDKTIVLGDPFETVYVRTVCNKGEEQQIDLQRIKRHSIRGLLISDFLNGK